MLVGVDEVVDLNVIMSFRIGDVTLTDARRMASAGMIGFVDWKRLMLNVRRRRKRQAGDVGVGVVVEFGWMAVAEVVVADTILS